MEKITFIEDNNGNSYNLNNVESIRLVKTKHLCGDIEPYVRVKGGTVKHRLFRKNIMFEEDGFILDSFGDSRYGGWYDKYYLTVKDFVNAMKEYWGKMPSGGYYSHLPVAEYIAGFFIAPNSDCIAYDGSNNSVVVKPHVIFYFDKDTHESFTAFGHFKPRMVVKVFNTDKAAEEYYNTVIK